jgi:Bacterial Ig domain
MLIRIKQLAVGLLCTIGVAVSSAQAQTPPNPIRGVNGWVYAVATDPQGNVYVGGDFTQAGNIYAQNIAKWNPSTKTWSKLEVNGSSGPFNGVSGPVKAIAIDYDTGKVYVGGAFYQAGDVAVANIAVWNPGNLTINPSWAALGAGLDVNFRPSTAEVKAIYVDPHYVGGGFVYVGGNFTKSGSLAVNNMAVWNVSTSTWTAMDNPGVVRSIEKWNSAIYVATGVGGVQVWSGSGGTGNWVTLSGGVHNQIYGLANAIKVDDGTDKLVVGGSFYLDNTVPIGGPPNKPCLAEWDGTSFTEVPTGGDNEVHALGQTGAEVAVGGSLYFPTDGNPTYWVNNTAIMWRWAWPNYGYLWDVMGNGNDNGVVGPVYALSSEPNYNRYDVYVGGAFNEIAGGECALNIACYNRRSMTWSALAQNQAPTVSITSPAGGSIFVDPATFDVSANASDDCTVTKVEFYKNGVLVGTATAAPYTINLSGLGQGSYSLTAKAYDNDGAITVSAPVNITVAVTVPEIINVQFGDPARITQKTGFAAIGNNSSDYWNVIGDSLKEAEEPPPGEPTLSASCVDSEGNSTPVVISLFPNSDLPGGGPGLLAADALFSGQLYTSGGGDYLVDIGGLPSGTYDVYFYALNPLNTVTHQRYTTTFTLLSGVGSVLNWSPLTTSTSDYDPAVYQEGNQYVVFRNLVDPGTLEFDVTGVGPILNGLQIVRH